MVYENINELKVSSYAWFGFVSSVLPGGGQKQRNTGLRIADLMRKPL